MKDDFSRRRNVYGTYRTWVFNALNDSLDAAILGTKTDDRVGLFNMFHLLMQLRNEKHASSRPCHEDISCMRDVLFCRGVDTREMEEAFPPSYNDSVCPSQDWTDDDYLPGDGGGVPSGLDGIDYMQLPTADPEHPKFRLK